MSEAIRDTEIGELLECGIIAVDKPQGPSSHQVTAWVKEILGGEVRIGHGGTLDPMVSGVLIIMLGRAVRLAPVILKHRKEYVAVLRLHGDVSKDDVLRTAEEFKGKIYQRPPRRSAVRRQLRIRTIYNIDILDFSNRLVLMRVVCEAGTYIRSLCTHMALSMGVGGQMEELRRTRSGSLGIPDSCTLQDLKDAFVFSQDGNSDALKRIILPVERLISEVPVVQIRDSAAEALCCGAVLAGVGVTARENYKRDALVAVVTAKNELVCIGKALLSSEEYKPGDTGLVVAPLAVVMKRGTYEKGWTKHEYKKEYSAITESRKDLKDESGKSEEMAKHQTESRPFKSENRKGKRDYKEKNADYQKSGRSAGENAKAERPYSYGKKSEYSKSGRPERRGERTEKPYSREEKADYSKQDRPVKIIKLAENPYYLDKTAKYSEPERPAKPAGKTYSKEKKDEYPKQERSPGKKWQPERPYSPDKKSEYKKRERTDKPHSYGKNSEYSKQEGYERAGGRTKRPYSNDREEEYKRNDRPAKIKKPSEKPEYREKKSGYSKPEKTEKPSGRVIKMKRIPEDKGYKKAERPQDKESGQKARSGFQPYKKTRK